MTTGEFALIAGLLFGILAELIVISVLLGAVKDQLPRRPNHPKGD